MHTRPAELHAFLRDVVNLAPDRLDSVRDTVNELRKQLVHHRERVPGFALMAILNSGSVEKKTAISPLNDVDVAVLLRPEEAPVRGRGLLELIRDHLKEFYQPKADADFTLGRHAVRIKFHGINLSVDVVPLIADPEKPGYAQLPTRDTDAWVSTAIPEHLAFIRERSGKYPVFLELVRLVKWWRAVQEVHFKSFLIELLAAHLLDTEQIPADDLHEAVLGFFGYVARTGLRERVSFDNGQAPSSEGAPVAPVQVLDPVNPANNVAAAIDEGRRRTLVEACREAFEALAAAQTAPTSAKARDYYRRVFGARFSSPADVPGEPTSPTAVEHVQAKIHADLRQLRVLNGGFTAEDAANKARAISLWLERGLAAEIELAYYHPASRERCLGLRYTIADAAESQHDSDPSGVPIASVGAAVFTLHVTGSEAWTQMDEEEKSAFYKELGGGWGPRERLSDGDGRWDLGRTVYSHGKLSATRTTFPLAGAP